MKRTQHAQEIAQRFRELVEEAGDSLPAQHYDELSMLIEAGIDTAMVELLENIADRVDQLGHAIRHDAEQFS